MNKPNNRWTIDEGKNILYVGPKSKTGERVLERISFSIILNPTDADGVNDQKREDAEFIVARINEGLKP